MYFSPLILAFTIFISFALFTVIFSYKIPQKQFPLFKLLSSLLNRTLATFFYFMFFSHYGIWSSQRSIFFSKIAEVIYCPHHGLWAGCIIFVNLYVFIFSLIICRRATYFTDSEMIKYYQTMCGWNSKTMKTKIQNYVRNYASYTMLKNHFLWLCWDVTRTSKENSQLQLAY